MALLGRATLALLLAGGDALLAHRGQAEDLSCLCLNWADVYKADSGHNVQCGQGMELFSTMDGMNIGLDSHVKNKVALAKSSMTASAALEKLKGTATYKRFCTDFFMKAKFNYCMNKRFMMTAEQVHSSKGSWCYVSSKCKLPAPYAVPVEGTNVMAKMCSPQVFDMPLNKMLMEDEAKVAETLHLDQGMLAGHAYIWKDMLVRDVTDVDIDLIGNLQEGKDGTFIMSEQDHFAPRWVVRKGSVYEHTYDNTTGVWTVKCKRDCYA
uniref:Uncharacterized protein n=1 Tax=Alexandrium andersonii TaxID=327968 RepID=A0A7S2D928_9DINO